MAKLTTFILAAIVIGAVAWISFLALTLLSNTTEGGGGGGDYDDPTVEPGFAMMFDQKCLVRLLTLSVMEPFGWTII